MAGQEAHLTAPLSSRRAVVTLYPYTRQKDNELSFSEGTIICVTRRYSDGWCEGIGSEGSGFLPGNSVQLLTAWDLWDADPGTAFSEPLETTPKPAPVKTGPVLHASWAVSCVCSFPPLQWEWVLVKTEEVPRGLLETGKNWKPGSLVTLSTGDPYAMQDRVSSCKCQL